MNSLINALASSVGRKLVMGVTGLFLCLFLVVHLAGNLLLYVGADAYNHYAHSLHEQQAFLIIAEILLYAAFIVHLVIAFKLTAVNLASRRNNYAVKKSKRTGRSVAAVIAPEAWMFWTGVVVLGFALVHVFDFKFEVGFQEVLDGKEPYEKAAIILATGSWRQLLYIAGSLFLGAHVSHGFASCFQSLGINHSRINCCLKWCSVAFGWIVAIGFASFPLLWHYSNLISGE